MEVEEIQSNGSRISRSSNGNVIRRRSDSIKVVPNDEDDGEQPKRRGSAAAAGRGGGVLGDAALMAGVNESGDGGRLREWHNSSRIIRVSRASGGKDRHSKVWTSRGLRDRRIRLSVNTAIEFYDLQDRLGYDQPSKAVEWLIEAAKDPIAELPSLNNSFPNTPNQLSNETISRPKGLDSVDAELDGEDFQQQQQPHHSLSKSACSSTSETSKVSGLSPSRTDPRVNREKARERARERASKEKEKDTDHNDSSHHHHHHHHHIVSPNASFTELLAGGIGTTNSTPMEYFNTGLLAPRPHHSSGFSGQIQLGGPLPAAAQSSSLVPASGFNVMAGENQPELQHFSLVPDHLIPVSSQPGGDYNLNFAISSGFNRGGTLQSNFSPLWPHIQRHSPTDVSNLPFFVGAPAPAPAVEPHHHHHQFPPGLDGRLQLSYGDGIRLSDHKGKGKN